MKLKICYTKLGNQFYFISSLSEWHFSFRYRKIFSEKWIEQTNTSSLSKKEKKALKDFTKIIKKYGFHYKNKRFVYLGIPFIVFFNEDKAWAKVKNLVNQEEYKKLKDIFEIFKTRFEKIWFFAYPQIESNKKILLQELKTKKTKKILETLGLLFRDRKILDSAIYIYLFPIPAEFHASGGSANIGENKIILELSPLTEEKEIIRALSAAFHEISHLFERKYFDPLLEKWIKENINDKEKEIIAKTELFKEIKDIKIILNEIIVHSLFPGYLCQKFLESDLEKMKEYLENEFKSTAIIPENNRNLTILGYYSAYHLCSFIEAYVNLKKPLDENYIQKAYELFKKFENIE